MFCNILFVQNICRTYLVIGVLKHTSLYYKNRIYGIYEKKKGSITSLFDSSPGHLIINISNYCISFWTQKLSFLYSSHLRFYIAPHINHPFCISNSSSSNQFCSGSTFSGTEYFYSKSFVPKY